VFGGISTKLARPVFMQGYSTNKDNVVEFLQLLRRQFLFQDKVYVVLDNHPAHHTLLVTDEAARLNFELMFMPPYSPELNAIEALWSVLKRNVKQQLVLRKLVNITQAGFEALLQGCLDNIRQEVQQAAAKHNNRNFILQCLDTLIEEQQPHHSESSDPVNEASHLSPFSGSEPQISPPSISLEDEEQYQLMQESNRRDENQIALSPREAELEARERFTFFLPKSDFQLPLDSHESVGPHGSSSERSAAE
jgi:transposase